jgi:hypothetical protein
MKRWIAGVAVAIAVLGFMPNLTKAQAIGQGQEAVRAQLEVVLRQLIATLMQQISELQTKLAAQQAQIETQEDRIDILDERVQEIPKPVVIPTPTSTPEEPEDVRQQREQYERCKELYPISGGNCGFGAHA